MKITRIETTPLAVPLHPERAIRSAAGSHTSSPFLLLQVHTDEGIIGLGEVSCTACWSGEDHSTASHIIHRYFEPALIGQDPAEIDKLMSKLHKLVAGNPFTKAGLEIAFWDILGKQAGLPLYRLLGSTGGDKVHTKFSVSGVAPEQAAKIADWAIAKGFRALKVKVGTDEKEDLARVAAVREQIGKDIRLGIDANGGWFPHQAARIIPALMEFHLDFVEQPVARHHLVDFRRTYGNAFPTIIADESIQDMHDAFALAAAGAADVFSLYIGKGAGISSARKTAAVAEAAGLTCTIGSNLELGVASAAMIHLALSTASIDSKSFPCDILSPFYYSGDILAEPLPIHPGYACAPTGPGLGVELDENKVSFYSQLSK